LHPDHRIGAVAGARGKLATTAPRSHDCQERELWRNLVEGTSTKAAPPAADEDLQPRSLIFKPPKSRMSRSSVRGPLAMPAERSRQIPARWPATPPAARAAPVPSPAHHRIHKPGLRGKPTGAVEYSEDRRATLPSDSRRSAAPPESLRSTRQLARSSIPMYAVRMISRLQRGRRPQRIRTEMRRKPSIC